jgi:7,8-dihydropterin-6-yl-methyl-4-(beta-D-ribofuranosyl)aminobenzene 5'-phosphate synthase
MRIFPNITLTLIFGWTLFMTQSIVEANSGERAEQDQVRLHVVYNNLPCKAGLQTAWGFACLIDGLDKNVLFDTGGDGDILLSNMQKLGLDAETVEAVVLSHIHGDHTGGLGTLLARNPDVTVYVPESFPASFKRGVKRFGAAIETVSGARHLFDSIYSTGEMNHGIKEQALIVDTARGLIVITGCAHPGVGNMAEQARSFLDKDIYLLMGGFHLSGRSDAEIRVIIKRLKALGVKKVAPSHCTGDGAIRLFREAWGENFIEGGLGAVIEVTPTAN